MKPFPKREEYDDDTMSTQQEADSSYAAFQEARADWYESEIVPLLREARKFVITTAASDGFCDRIDAVLKVCEEGKP